MTSPNDVARVNRSKDPLDILYIGTLPPHPGGTGIFGYQVLRSFARAGNRVRALAPDTPQSGSRFVHAYSEIEQHRFLMPHFEIPPNFPYLAELAELERQQVNDAMMRLIDERRPDLILIGRETYMRFVPDLSAAQGLCCALIVHGGLTHGIIDGTHPPEFANSLLAQYRKADLIITPSNHMATALRNFGLTVSVIPNPVDLKIFYPAKSNVRRTFAEEEDIVVSWIGHFRPLKRPLDLIRIADVSLRKNPRLKFLALGDGPLLQEVENLCKEKLLMDRFHFTGWIEHVRIPDYINASDIVLTTTAVENQALVYLEAQACGRFLLASDIVAAREVIEDGKTGVLYKMGDIEDGSDKLLAAAEDHSLRTAIGVRARKAVQSHSLERVVPFYLAAFDRLVSTVIK